MTPSERFLELAATLGGISQRALNNFFYWHNPFALQNWTLNVVELVMIGAAGLALAHAITVRRRTGDPSYLGVWIAAVVYCIVIEVPIYFTPGLIGLDGAVIFIHNEFSAGALYGRMPLYILALYPALLYPAYVLVRQRGLFDGRWGLMRGAVCVGFVHHCFYEVFDHLGPQLKWFLWDYHLPDVGDVTLASVPLYSQVNFSMVNATAFALLAHALLGRGRQSTGRRGALTVTGMALLAGSATPLLGVVLSPNLIYARLVEEPNRLVIYALSYGVFVVVALLAASALWRTRTVSLRPDAADGIEITYVPIFAMAYLAACALLWAVSLPDYLNASGGITASGTRIGSLPYAAACAGACVWLVMPYVNAIRRSNSTRSFARPLRAA